MIEKPNTKLSLHILYALRRNLKVDQRTSFALIQIVRLGGSRPTWRSCRGCFNERSKFTCAKAYASRQGGILRIGLAVCSIGAVALETLVPVHAQYYYPPPPNYSPPPPGYGYGYQTGNGCPPGYTVQGGNCAPYRGPGGGGWNTWNGCPPGYTVQGGNCASYRGPVGPGYGYYGR